MMLLTHKMEFGPEKQGFFFLEYYANSICRMKFSLIWKEATSIQKKQSN